MRKALWTLLLAGGIAAGMTSVACGSDNGTSSSSSSSSGNIGDSGIPDANQTTNPDGGDGGCTFASFVIGLENQPSNSAPSTDLGQNCPDDMNQADFASLFPQTH